MLLKLTPQIYKKISAKTTHRGLIPKYDGPFEIVKKVGKVAYRLKLPERLKLHPTFHVSFLKPYNEDDDPSRKQAKRAPPTIRAEFHRKIMKILDHRTLGNSKKNRRTEYLVKWQGAPDEDISWEKGAALWQFEEKIVKYHARDPTRTLDSSGGGGLSDPH